MDRVNLSKKFSLFTSHWDPTPVDLTDFYSPRALREHLAAYLRAWNRHPTGVRVDQARSIIRSHRQMLERISTAVH